MRAVESSGRGRKTDAAILAVLLVIVLQIAGFGVGWPQQAQPGMDEERARQQEIYHSRGAKVPDGYVTYRAFSDYVQLLPSGFCDTLGSLGSSDRWLDIGAGNGQAILDYYSGAANAAPDRKCSGARGKARAVAISIEDRRTDQWRQQVARLDDDRIRYLFGKTLRHYSLEELGKFQIITDVYGGFSYTEDLSLFLQKVLSFLAVDGIFYTVAQNVSLEAATDKAGDDYQTKLVDTAGRNVKLCSWLKKTTCVKVLCESKSDWDSPSELIHVQKVCSDVSVPRMKLLQFQAGNPPARRFQLEPPDR